MQILTEKIHIHFVKIAIFTALLGGLGCFKGQEKVNAPIEPAAPATAPEKSVNPTRMGQSVMLGWFCPELAVGRPAIRPLLARDPGWTDDEKRLANAIGTRRVKRFSVLGWLGRRAGSFSVAGLARDSSGSLAIGSYLGSSACETSMLGQEPSDDPNCKRVIRGCALALAVLEDAGGFEARPYEEDPDSMEYAMLSACEQGDVLVLDTDGDGTMERFSLAPLLNKTPAPAELAAVSSDAVCEANFAAVVTEDVVRLATIDMDGDGRSEVVYRRGESEFLLFGAPNHPARLELLGRYILTVD